MRSAPDGPRPPSTYERLLRLQHLRFRPWQRETLTWGMLVLGALLALTGLVDAWIVLLLPLLVAAVVKAHDVLTPRIEAAARGMAGAAEPASSRETTEPPVG